MLALFSLQNFFEVCLDKKTKSQHLQMLHTNNLLCSFFPMSQILSYAHHITKGEWRIHVQMHVRPNYANLHFRITVTTTMNEIGKYLETKEGFVQTVCGQISPSLYDTTTCSLSIHDAVETLDPIEFVKISLQL